MKRETFQRLFFFLLLPVLLLVSPLRWGWARQVGKPGVVFLSPAQDDLWTGTRQIKIQLQNLNHEDVRVVELYLDGRLLKEFVVPPYTWSHSFGPEGQNRVLKVVVRDQGLGVLATAELKSYQVYDRQSLEVRLVMVPVVVKDKKGNHVRGLKKEDFILLSEGERLEISYLSTRGTERFSLVQVIDISYSMRDKIHDVLNASQDFVEQLLTENDRGTFVFFNQRVYDHMGFTGKVDELIERLDLRAPVMGGTALYDGIAYSLNLLSKTPGWNIIVIFSDGEDNCSYIDGFSLVKMVKKSPVVIYAIDNRKSGANDVLGKICSSSGGRLFPLADIEKTANVYEEIREEIKAQYILFFDPAKGRRGGGGKRFRPLTVKVENRQYRIRTIRGYYD